MSLRLKTGGRKLKILRNVAARKLEKKMMTNRIRATTVIDYIVQRLPGEGITDCFGIPPDYVFRSVTQSSAAQKSNGSAAKMFECVFAAVLAASVMWFSQLISYQHDRQF
jgi:hypothetical protein